MLSINISRNRNRFAAIIVFVFATIANLMIAAPSKALSAASLSFDSDTPGPTCASSNITLWAYYTASVDDSNGNNEDAFSVAAYDGNGNLLATEHNAPAAPAGKSDQTLNNFTLTGITARPVTFVVYDTDETYNIAGAPVMATLSIDPASIADFPSDCASLPIGGVKVAPTGAKDNCYTDGRVNKCDIAQPVAIYCQNGGVVFYTINEGKGYFSFKVTKDELSAVPQHPSVNTLVKSSSDGSIRLYRLNTGELQVNAPTRDAGKDYVFIWKGC